MTGRHRPERRLTVRRWALIATAALLAMTGVAWAATPSATAEPGLSPLELAQVTKANCEVLLAKATTSAQRTRARNCITDQTAIVVALSPSPTPSASPSPSSSPTPAPDPSPSPSTPSAPPPSPSTTPEPVPSPTPSPTPTGLPLNCRTDPSACGYPDADNTGVPPGTVLTPMPGGTINVAGTVIDSRAVSGCLTIQAPNVIIRNSRITCSGWRAVDGQSNGTLVEDSELVGNGANGSGIDGAGVTGRRLEIRGVENGLAVHGSILLEDSWIHSLAPTSVAGAHSDGAQLFGHQNITLRHNTILLPGANAAITRHVADFTHSILIEDNFLGGGTYTLYCPWGPGSFQVRDNRFADGTEQYGMALSCGGVAWSGNYRDSNGAVVLP